MRPAALQQEYVKRRVVQFIEALQPHMLQHLPAELLQRLVIEAYHSLPPPVYGLVPVENLELQIVFRHDCM